MKITNILLYGAGVVSGSILLLACTKPLLKETGMDNILISIQNMEQAETEDSGTGKKKPRSKRSGKKH